MKLRYCLQANPEARTNVDFGCLNFNPAYQMSAIALEWKPVFEPLSFARQLSTRTAQQKLTVEEIKEGICNAASHSLKRASTLPAQAYTSEEFFAWEVEHLLRGGWQCLGQISQIPKAGDFLNLDLLGEPLIVVRDGEIDGSLGVIAGLSASFDGHHAGRIWL